MSVYFNSFYNYTTSIFKGGLISSLTTQRIRRLAALTFGVLAATYLATRYCLKSPRAKQELPKTSNLPQPSVNHLPSENTASVNEEPPKVSRQEIEAMKAAIERTKAEAAQRRALIQQRIRPQYQSFAEYQKERETRGEAVDLIVGRGTTLGRPPGSAYGHSYLFPKLNEQRLSRGKDQLYRPFTIDTDSSLLPDLEGSITSLSDLKHIPSNSVDDIYLEHLFPGDILHNIDIYITAARILKIDGTLVADFNGQTRAEQEKFVNTMQKKFIELEIPFAITLVDDKQYARNDANISKFRCIKCDNFDWEAFHLKRDQRKRKPA